MHIVSEPFMTGGHTRLMEKLASMHAEPVDLLISRQAAPDAKAQVCRFLPTPESLVPRVLWMR